MERHGSASQNRYERLAFEIYLRTGRIVGLHSENLQVKFNPWHARENGRFTFAGQGAVVELR